MRKLCIVSNLVTLDSNNLPRHIILINKNQNESPSSIKEKDLENRLTKSRLLSEDLIVKDIKGVKLNKDEILLRVESLFKEKETSELVERPDELFSLTNNFSSSKVKKDSLLLIEY